MQFRELVNITEETTLQNWLQLNEATTATRYSIEVNFRSKIDEIKTHFAKICLGFVSAALKQRDFHTKHVYEVDPIRLVVASRNFDDGEWVVAVTFNPKHDDGCFIISQGFWNKDRRTVSIQSNKKCNGDSAADVTKEVLNTMNELRSKPDRYQEKLKGVHLKRGPKR